MKNPDLVATNPTISFKTAIWFWRTPQANKPIITRRWNPSAADRSAGRLPGYGVITNIINGVLECGKGPNDRVVSRVGFYKRCSYCDILGVSYGNNLDCYNQRPFAQKWRNGWPWLRKLSTIKCVAKYNKAIVFLCKTRNKVLLLLKYQFSCTRVIYII